MTSSFDLSVLSREFLNGHLTDAMNEMANGTASSGKRLYELDGEVSLLTQAQAKTAGHAHLIGLNQLTKVFDENIPKLKVDVQLSYSNALRVYAEVLGTRLKVDEKQLKHAAEIEGCGYKKANLDQVKMLCKEGFGTYQLKVPEYEGISSDAVQNALNSCGLDVAAKWKGILDKHFPTENERQEAFRTKKFPPTFLSACAALQLEIRAAIKVLRQNPENKTLDQIFGLPNLDSLVEMVRHKNERFMVRSSGKEDTKELANAGGNTSVANVAPNLQDILQALEETVVSYFGEKSLKARLLASDVSLFEPVPFTPFLLQRMIGERDPKALPKCGVMFTEDCQSKTASKGTTSGITVINSAYGHNEGVVTSEIPVDTYYVTSERDVIPLITPKTYRMMPTAKSGELQLVANDSKVAKAPSLSMEAITTLKNFAERLEQFYGGPMDVEFVIEEQANTIYIVQARPLVEKRFKSASYLPDLRKFKSSEVLKGSAIGVAGGSLVLAKPSEIIVASTLIDAFNLYRASQDPSSIKAVVIGTSAPSTSHWATVFHNDSIPVLHINDLSTLQSWQTNSQAQILMSPQQGVVVNLKSEKPLTIEDLEKEGLAVKGWVDYPAAPHLSTSLQFRPKELLTDEAIQAFHPNLKSPEKWAAFQQHATLYEFETLFERIKLSQGEDLSILLSMLLYKFNQVLKVQAASLKMDKEQLTRIACLQSYALSFAKNIRGNSDYSPQDDVYCRKLLPIHFLHALIFSQSLPEELVDGNSLTSVALIDMREERKLAHELKAQGITLKSPYSLTLLRLNKVALVEETKSKFRQMVITLDQEGKENDLKVLSKMLDALKQLDLLSIWLNVAFPKNPDLHVLTMDFVKQASFFKELAEKREMLNALNIMAFANPKSFHTQWQEMNRKILDYVKSEQFAENFKNADVVGKLAAVALMNKVVDQFDQAIKALERSEEYPLEQKLILFQTMLKGFKDLAGGWFRSFNFYVDFFNLSQSDVIKKKLNYSKFAISADRKRKIGERLQISFDVIDKKFPDIRDFAFSENFDVSAFCSRSGAILRKVVHPYTYEDAFSSIHSELQAMLNFLIKEEVGTDMFLPPLFARAIDQLSLSSEDLSGIELNSRCLTYCFSKVLRDHGIQYRLEYPIGSESLKLKVRFSAENENQRWDKIAHFMVMLKVGGKFDLSEFQLDSGGLEFTFHLDENDNLERLSEIFFIIEQASSKIASDSKTHDTMSVRVAFEVENLKKKLESITDDRLIIQEFERICGFKSMLRCSFVETCVQNLIKQDPAFVESVMIKSWEIKDGDWGIKGGGHLPLFFSSVLPELLLNAGHAVGLICKHGMQMINTKDVGSMQNGMRLIVMVSRKDPEALPEGCAREVFAALLDEKLRSDISFQLAYYASYKFFYDQALEVLDALMQLGKDGDLILQGVLPMLSSRNPDIQVDGKKILELLHKNQHYYPLEFQVKIKETLQKLNVDASQCLQSEHPSLNIHIKEV